MFDRRGWGRSLECEARWIGGGRAPGGEKEGIFKISIYALRTPPCRTDRIADAAGQDALAATLQSHPRTSPGTRSSRSVHPRSPAVQRTC